MSLTLRRTVSRPVLLSLQSQRQSYFTTGGVPPTVRPGAEPLETHGQNLFSQLNICGHSPYITSSLTREWVCHLQLLLVPRQRIHSRVRVSWDSWPYITVSDSRLPFCLLLRLAGLRWRYSTPPPHRSLLSLASIVLLITFRHSARRRLRSLLYSNHFRETCLFAKALLSNGCVYVRIKKLLSNSGCCFVVCFEVVTQKQVYKLQ
jgi:hypothetical protein